MKFVFILVLVQLILITVKGQRNSSLSTRKYVVDLKKKVAPMAPKHPNERRKLPMFPKNLQKYVVTSKPYSKVRTYTPRAIFMKKMTFRPVYDPSFTTKKPVTASMKLYSIVEWPRKVPESRIHRRIIEEKHVNNNMGYEVTQGNDSGRSNEIKDDSEEISTGMPEFAEDGLTGDFDNNIQIDFNTLSELDNLRIKRLAVQGPTVHDSWYFRNVARVPQDDHYGSTDEDEFIFINNEKQTQSSTNVVPKLKSSRRMSSSVSPTPPSNSSSRSKRSSNVIEEETRVTTVSGYKSGQVHQLSSDMVFKNIHA